jgi:hypothetical protein
MSRATQATILPSSINTLQSNQAKTDKSELNYLIKAAANGFYPLFFQEWISESFKMDLAYIGHQDARKKVEEYLKQLSRHHQIARKQVALMAMSTRDRNYFIRYFFKLVEFEILDRHEKLH